VPGSQLNDTAIHSPPIIDKKKSAGILVSMLLEPVVAMKTAAVPEAT
jgi:hypothetical protein